MKTREEIITSMCLTWRHDYGIDKKSFSGTTKEERDLLWNKMAQIFDNDISPNMIFKENRKTKTIRNGIIQVQSFELTEKEKARIRLGLKYGPAAASMKDDGTFFENSTQKSWKSWIGKKFLGKL